MDLTGKNILVTGSAKRVGKEISLRLADSGANIAVHYNTSKEEADQTTQEIKDKGVESKNYSAELSNPDEITRLIDDITDDLGEINALVNNASIFYRTPFQDVTVDDWDRNLDINLRAPFFLSQIVANQMDEGKIVNIADWSGIRPYTNYLPYCISKAGIIALTRGLAKELAPSIAVNAIAPGPVMLPTDFGEEEKQEILENTPLNRIGEPRDIAEGVAFMLEGTDFVTGAILPIDGGRLIA